jgi:uncharacterized membrane protein
MLIFNTAVGFWVGGNMLFFGWLVWPGAVAAVGARSRDNGSLRFTTGG